MKKFLFVPMLIILLFLSFNAVFSQNCDLLVQEAILLINNAQNAFLDDNPTLGNAYLNGAKSLLKPCATTTCPISSIFDQITQTQNATNNTVRSALFDTIQTLLSLCMSGNTTATPLASTSSSRAFVGIQTFVNGVAITPNGLLAATNSSDYSIIIWDIPTGNQLYDLTAFQQTNLGMATAFSPNGRYLATSDFAGNVVLWDYRQNTVIYTWKHDSYVWHVEFNPISTILASVGGDGFLKLYNVRTGAQIRSMNYRTSPLRGLAFSPDGRQILVGSEDGDLILWNTDTGERLLVLSGHQGMVNDTAFSPDGDRAVSLDNTGTMMIWDLSAATLITGIQAHSQQAFALLWLPKTNRILTGGDDGFLRVWDGTTYDRLAQYSFDRRYIRAIANMPDETAILLGMNDGTVTLFPLDQ